jgi:hypothetical protein
MTEKKNNESLTKCMCHGRGSVLHIGVSFIISSGVVGQIREGENSNGK